MTPPSPGAEWEHNNGVSRKLRQSVDSSALATTAYTPDGADDLTNRDSMHRQYVSNRLAAQTISGNITGQIQCLEAHANNNLFVTIVVKVISADGSTVRSTLLSITRATSLEVATSLTNRTFPSTAMGSYACAEGDRLMIEIGLGGNITTAAGGVQGHNGSIRWGCSASGGDLAVNETETGTTFRGWFEFSNTFTFSLSMDAGSGSYSVTGANASLGFAFSMDAESGMYTQTGFISTLALGKTLNAASASYSLGGSAASLAQTHLFTADPASYVMSGVDASFSLGLSMSAEGGAYAYTGFNATLRESALVMNAQPSSYTVTGSLAATLRNRVLIAALGSYTASGQAATMLHNLVMIADSGTYSVTGSSAVLVEGGGGGGGDYHGALMLVGVG